MTSPPSPPYKVELLQRAREEVTRCLREAQRLGIAQEFVATMRQI